MAPIIIIAVFIALALLLLLMPKKPMVANVSSEEEILEIAQTNKIEAIKEYRAMYGVGLKDAKEAVERMLRDGKVINPSGKNDPIDVDEKLAEIKKIAAVNKIQAIKEYRALYGVGLKEAKEAVDAM